MKPNQKIELINEYSYNFKNYKANPTEANKMTVQSQKRIMKLFFTESDLEHIENNVITN